MTIWIPVPDTDVEVSSDGTEWVTDLDYFDERWGEVRLVRKRWPLIDVDELVLPDPHPVEDDQ